MIAQNTEISPSAVSKGMEYVPVILNFFREIGIPARMEKIDSKTFVPGLIIRNGELIIDKEKMLYPGDMLHEAGHIAVTPEAKRSALSEVSGDGEEIAAILWSFAAAKKIGVPLEILFHADGYKGDSDWLIENFQNKKYIGLPLLEWMGFTASEKKAAELNVPPFPHMIQWLRK
jgi:hypothetical protein